MMKMMLVAASLFFLGAVCAQEATTVPPTVTAPATTAAPVTTAVPETTAAPVTTAAPETTAAPVTTAAPATTTEANVTDTTMLTTPNTTTPTPATPTTTPNETTPDSTTTPTTDHTHPPPDSAGDCIELQRLNYPSGIYKLSNPAGGSGPIEVYCDMDSDGGGWIVFQKRVDGSQSFDLEYESYVKGFGKASANYWLGLRNIYGLTERGNTELRVDMWDCEDQNAWAKYGSFRLSPPSDYYRLRIRGFDELSTAGDSLTNAEYGNGYVQNMKRFTARGNDWDELGGSGNDDEEGIAPNCGILYKGGFWFKRCGVARPNGEYKSGCEYETESGIADGITWLSWRPDNQFYSAKRFEMKIRDPSRVAPSTPAPSDEFNQRRNRKR